MKMLIEVYMDGYENEEDREKAAIEYIEELDSAGVSVKVLEIIKK